MKTLKEVIEVENEGMVSLLNEQVLIFCMNYIYTGKLVGVNDTFLKIEKCYIVYETGAHSDSKFKDAQLLAEHHYIQISSIESFGKTLKTI